MKNRYLSRDLRVDVMKENNNSYAASGQQPLARYYLSLSQIVNFVMCLVTLWTTVHVCWLDFKFIFYQNCNIVIKNAETLTTFNKRPLWLIFYLSQN